MSSPGTPRVWVASPSEVAEVARLLGEFRDFLGNSTPSVESIAKSVERIQARGDGLYLLGETEKDAPPAGVAQLRFRPSVWTGTEDAWLEDLFVAEGARGSGLGRLLVEFGMDVARERGCARIELDVQEENEAALALYAATGFDSKRAAPGGRALFMQRTL
ncbi:MAG: GNAT family N-acetyltransferase [Thermoleophilaceae bacterium]|nr:GNAT family N-acetyltransferase [Thermoleophilaceae bacterium]